MLEESKKKKRKRKKNYHYNINAGIPCINISWFNHFMGSDYENHNKEDDNLDIANVDIANVDSGQSDTINSEVSTNISEQKENKMAEEIKTLNDAFKQLEGVKDIPITFENNHPVKKVERKVLDEERVKAPSKKLVENRKVATKKTTPKTHRALSEKLSKEDIIKARRVREIKEQREKESINSLKKNLVESRKILYKAPTNAKKSNLALREERERLEEQRLREHRANQERRRKALIEQRRKDIYKQRLLEERRRKARRNQETKIYKVPSTRNIEEDRLVERRTHKEPALIYSYKDRKVDENCNENCSRRFTSEAKLHSNKNVDNKRVAIRRPNTATRQVEIEKECFSNKDKIDEERKNRLLNARKENLVKKN